MKREICRVLASARRRVRGRDLFLSPQMEVFKKPSIAEIRLTHTHTHARGLAHTHTIAHTHTHRQGAREMANHSNGRPAIKTDNRERIQKR